MKMHVYSSVFTCLPYFFMAVFKRLFTYVYIYNEETRILTFRIFLQGMQILCLAAYIKTFVTARFLE